MHFLGTQFTEFQSDFFACYNTLFEEVFELCFELLCIKYPEASSYLKNVYILLNANGLNVSLFRYVCITILH
jgi:hypothetical protein